MFRSVNVSIWMLAEYAADRGLLALRWGLDVTRGYHRAASQREGVLEHLHTGGRAKGGGIAAKYAECALYALGFLGELRAASGAFGVGARLAVSPAEFVELRVAAENLRSEALRQEQQNTWRAA